MNRRQSHRQVQPLVQAPCAVVASHTQANKQARGKPPHTQGPPRLTCGPLLHRDSAHQRPQRLRHTHRRAVAELGAGGVLAGQDAPGVDGLALGEEVGVALARRLLRRQPAAGPPGRAGPQEDKAACMQGSLSTGPAAPQTRTPVDACAHHCTALACGEVSKLIPTATVSPAFSPGGS